MVSLNKISSVAIVINEAGDDRVGKKKKALLYFVFVLVAALLQFIRLPFALGNNTEQ